MTHMDISPAFKELAPREGGEQGTGKQTWNKTHQPMAETGWRPALDRVVRGGPEKWERLAIGRAIQAVGTTCAKAPRQERA